MEICSWMPVNFYKHGNNISRFPQTWREWVTLPQNEYATSKQVHIEYTWDFMEDWAKLFLQAPKMKLQQWFENENSTYAELYWGKNCYLSFGVGQQVENLLYTMMSHSNLRNVLNSFVIVGSCENIYSSRSVTSSYKIFYSSNIHNSHNIWFSSNLVWCFECIQCDWLTNQSYCIKNQQLSKDEYEKEKQDILSQIWLFDQWEQEVMSKKNLNKLSENVFWSWIVASRDIEDGYFVQKVNWWRNIFLWWWEDASHHFYDSFDVGNQVDEHLYGCHYVWETSSHVYFVTWWANLTHCYYGYHLEACSYCFGCIWLKNKSFCILNNQYTKEEWFEKVDEIFEQMEQDWGLWKFFPASMNPFYFNDTAACLIEPTFTKEEVSKLWYLWRDDPIHVDIPAWVSIVNSHQLWEYEEVVEWKLHISPDILKKVLIDEQGNAYRIIPMEYDFLVKYWLPLPRKHWQTRLKEKFKI